MSIMFRGKLHNKRAKRAEVLIYRNLQTGGGSKILFSFLKVLFSRSLEPLTVTIYIFCHVQEFYDITTNTTSILIEIIWPNNTNLGF